MRFTGACSLLFSTIITGRKKNFVEAEDGRWVAGQLEIA